MAEAPLPVDQIRLRQTQMSAFACEVHQSLLHHQFLTIVVQDRKVQYFTCSKRDLCLGNEPVVLIHLQLGIMKQLAVLRSS